MNASATTIRTHHEKDSAIYLEIQMAIIELAKCDDLRQRKDMAECIRCRLSDFALALGCFK